MANIRIHPDRPLTSQECHARSAAKKRQNGHCRSCNKPSDRPQLNLCSKCNDKANVRGREYRRLLKAETFAAYGGAMCACPRCQTYGLDFLTLDHMDGNDWQGYKWRAGDKLYRELKNLGYPAGFRVLCFNCNCARYLNGGICPHEKGV